MDPNLFRTPPPLHADWLAHEEAANLLSPKPVIEDASERRHLYSQACKALNAELLAGRDKHLTEGIITGDTLLEAQPGSLETHYIPIRRYHSVNFSSVSQSAKKESELSPVVIYLHGGGLYVGDLDSEDLTCRRICKNLQCTVYSCTYRKLPEFTADDALSDALRAFQEITSQKTASKWIIMGSSSGGQLAAQISQHYRRTKLGGIPNRIHGVLLRGPVTCNATDGGIYLPERFKGIHTSMTEAFHTSVLSGAAVNNGNRTSTKLPLEEDHLKGMPRHWIQISTNDIYYADGACYTEALKEAGVDVKLDIVVGWPHTFWLKAPYLERAVEAERDMIEGLEWLLESESSDENSC